MSFFHSLSITPEIGRASGAAPPGPALAENCTRMDTSRILRNPWCAAPKIKNVQI